MWCLEKGPMKGFFGHLSHEITSFCMYIEQVSGVAFTLNRLYESELFYLHRCTWLTLSISIVIFMCFCMCGRFRCSSWGHSMVHCRNNIIHTWHISKMSKPKWKKKPHTKDYRAHHVLLLCFIVVCRFYPIWKAFQTIIKL